MPTNINWNQVVNNGVKLAKISKVDNTGNNISDYLSSIQSFVIPWPDVNGGPIEYIIIDRQNQTNHYLFFIYPQPLSPNNSTFTSALPALFDPGISQTYYAPGVQTPAGLSTRRYTIPFTNGNYDVTMNNASTPQYSAKFMDVDYTVGITTPYNFKLLISGTADRAPVQDTNYESAAWSNIRYNGSRQSSIDFNTPY
jgi:hypothetical protein